MEKIIIHGVEMFTTERFKNNYLGDNYEKFSVLIFSAYSEKEHVILDIGAHHGFYSLIAAKNGASVMSFEPVKENFEILKKNVDSNKDWKIKPFNLAITNSIEKKCFNIAEDSSCSGFSENPISKTIKKINVDAVSIDSQMAGRKVDLVKIDTEGHEMEVLDGMKEVIDHNPDIKFLIEFNPKCLRSAQKKPSEMLKWLLENEFRIFFIKDREKSIIILEDEVKDWNKIIDPVKFINIFCVKKSKNDLISFLSHLSAKNIDYKVEYISKKQEIIPNYVLRSKLINSAGAIEEKDKEINKLLDNLKVKDREINKLLDNLKVKDREINKLSDSLKVKNEEIIFIKSSKFWKMRTFYLKIKKLVIIK